MCLSTPGMGVLHLHPIILSTTGPMSFLGEGTIVPGSGSLSWEVPSPRFFSRSLVPDHFLGAPQSQVLSQVSGPRSFPDGTPVADGGTPFLGYPPSQDWGTPIRFGVLPLPGLGIPSQTGLGYPQPGQD